MSRPSRLVPVILVLFIWSMTTHGKFSDSGDEPHYLIVAESLFADRDLDLTNNFANDDARWFGANGLEHGLHARVNRSGALWTSHDIGVPILIVPIYAAATRLAAQVPESWLARFRQTRGLFAYSIVSLSLACLTSASIWLVVCGLRRRMPEVRAAAIGLVFGLSPPVVSHAFLVFPETVAFAVVCAVVWMLLVEPDEIRTGRMLALIAAVGCLPWLHRKYSFFVFGLVFVLVLRHRGWFGRLPAVVKTAMLALAVVPQVVLHVWTHLAWGTLGGPQMVEGLPFTLAGLQRGALGLLFDRERGLVAYAPVYLLVPAGWALVWREARALLVPVALLFLPMAAYVVWSAGFSPAARYLVPLTPLLMLPVALAIGQRRLGSVAIALLAFQAVITAVLWRYPRALWPSDQGTNVLLEGIPILGAFYERLLPSIATGDSVIWGWIWVAAVMVGGRISFPQK